MSAPSKSGAEVQEVAMVRLPLRGVSAIVEALW